MERPHKADSLADFADPEKNLVSPLGILGIELNLDLAKEFPDLRIPTGVVVAAKTLGGDRRGSLANGRRDPRLERNTHHDAGRIARRGGQAEAGRRRRVTGRAVWAADLRFIQFMTTGTGCRGFFLRNYGPNR